MFLTMVFYLTVASLLAVVLSLAVRLAERKLIGIASEKGDVYVACFLSTIGITALTNLLYIALSQVWWLYQVARVLAVFVIFLVLFRAILKHKASESAVLSIAATVTLFVVIYGFVMIGIAI